MQAGRANAYHIVSPGPALVQGLNRNATEILHNAPSARVKEGPSCPCIKDEQEVRLSKVRCAVRMMSVRLLGAGKCATVDTIRRGSGLRDGAGRVL